MDNQDRELGWNDEIENDGPEFTVLPEGDYDFEVTEFERGRHPGSDKLPPCNKAVVSIRIEGKEGISTVKHQLFLHTKTEGLLCNFFTAIGQRQKGQRVSMDWNKVVGSKGRAKVGIRKWTNDKGDTLEFNDIKKFYEPEKPAFEEGKF